MLVSSPGVGKTHPSIAIGHEAVMARRQVYFADCSRLVNRRYALKRSTIVTTNVPVGRWGDVFGSNVTASAVADGLCHHCAMIKITGRSYRLKDVSIGGEDGREEERA